MKLSHPAHETKRTEGGTLGGATNIAKVDGVTKAAISLDGYQVATGSFQGQKFEFVNSLTYSGIGNLVFASSSTTTTTFNSEKQSILLDSSEKSLSIATGSFGGPAMCTEGTVFSSPVSSDW